MLGGFGCWGWAEELGGSGKKRRRALGVLDAEGPGFFVLDEGQVSQVQDAGHGLEDLVLNRGGEPQD